ncbi:peptidoglycan DD-metalloendopeptidase family protein [Aquabacterium sp. A3]|uniref:peptidoglycan DD-metalloendopeptidase family protein n=1 Tax=Aquabacterium sp. A3 TaxID=3132829 RepID=UPI0031194559
MQILITTSVFKQPRVLQFTPWSVMLVAVLLIVPVMMVTAMAYHSLLMQATRINLPVVSDAARFLQKNERDRRERYMRENLDAMAVKVGELQARLVWLETVSERVAGMAGIKPEEFQVPETGAAGASAPAGQSGQGGPYAPLRSALQQPSKATLEALREEIDLMNQQGEQQADVLTLIESRLFEKRLDALMVPSSAPVAGGVIGSGFGFRSDPFRGTRALHTGLDFPAPTGTSIGAAAGGVVLTAETHHQYGQMIELDHGNKLITRYAHASKLLVKPGDLVKRGQKIAEVGSTGRSTGPHLHFEVLVDGVHQNPARFLKLKEAPPLNFAETRTPLH